MLRINNLTVRVLKNLNLTLAENETAVVIGENGTGKTTLFNAIAGYVKPGDGSVFINGEDVSNMPRHARAALISNVFQDPKVGTIGRMTIRENLNLSYARGKSRNLVLSDSSDRDNIYKEKLSVLKMNLENRLDNRVEELSGGQRQALSIVMSTIADSKLLLLDEITAALDPKSSENVLNIVSETLKRKRKTCVMITHDLKSLDRFGDKAFVLRDGRLEARKSYL
jgi:putative ABC transport system ATP-binding protein